MNKTLANITAGQGGDFGRDFQNNLKKNWTEAFARLEDEDPTVTFTEAEYLRETSQVVVGWHLFGHLRNHVSGLGIDVHGACMFFSLIAENGLVFLGASHRYQRLFRCRRRSDV